MSRIGKTPIIIPAGVTVNIVGQIATVTGPKGNLVLNFPSRIVVDTKDGIINVSRLSEDKKVKACHGSTRAHLNNMVTGVVTPWKKELEIRGTGYKFSLSGNKLVVLAGFIHPVNVEIPSDIQAVVVEEVKLTLTGIDKVRVGQLASNIRKIRTPEPYKGKGIRYLNEFIKLKAGKTAKT